MADARALLERCSALIRARLASAEEEARAAADAEAIPSTSFDAAVPKLPSAGSSHGSLAGSKPARSPNQRRRSRDECDETATRAPPAASCTAALECGRREATARAERLEAIAEDLRTQLRNAGCRAHTLAAELNTLRGRSESQAKHLEEQRERSHRLEQELAQAKSDAARKHFESAARIAELEESLERATRQETELHCSPSGFAEPEPEPETVPREEHRRAVGELEAQVEQGKQRMIELDQKFKQLWQRMKDENVEVRNEVAGAKAELGRERQRREKEETRARDAHRRAKELEQRVRFLERDTYKLRELVKSVKEQSQIMRTIARIRTETEHNKEASMGFDALVRTIDNVHSEVERQCQLSGIM